MKKNHMPGTKFQFFIRFVLLICLLLTISLTASAEGEWAEGDTLFQDDFTHAALSQWQFPPSSVYEPRVVDDALHIVPVKTPPTGNYLAVVLPQEDQPGWGSGQEDAFDNYAVRSEVRFDSVDYGGNKFVGIAGRQSDAGYYEFRLYYNRSAIYADLYYFHPGGNARLTRYTPAQITAATGSPVEYGQSVLLEARFIENRITMFINGAELGTAVHGLDVALKKGNPGVKVSTTGGAFDDFQVNQMLKSFQAGGSWTPKITKSLKGRTIQDKEFAFQLIDAQGQVLETARNNHLGEVVFSPILFTQADIGQVFTYTIVETAAEEQGIRQENKVLDIRVKVLDAGGGILYGEADYSQEPAFHNAYEATGTWAPVLHKTLKGRALKEGEFDFALHDEEGSLLETATNRADGQVMFDGLAFSQEDINQVFQFQASELEGHEPGMHYDDHAVPFTVRVTDKGDGELHTRVLSYPDWQTFLELKKQFDGFTPYEVKTLGSAYSHYISLLDGYERFLHPELAGYDTLLRSDFHDPKPYEWSHTYETNAHKWTLANGGLLGEFQTSSAHVTGWAVPQVYARIVSMSADIMLLKEKMFAGIGINLNAYGYYHARILNNAVDEDGNIIYAVQLLKKTRTGHRVLANVNVDDIGMAIRLGEWNNLRLTLLEGVLSVYLDDQLVISYDDSQSDTIFDQGQAGIRISAGDARFDNVSIIGEAAEPVPAPPIVPGEYQVAETQEITGKSTLHVHEKDPDITFRLKPGPMQPDSRWGVSIREIADSVYTRVGYDAQLSRWYIESTQGVDFETQRFYSDAHYYLQPDAWYTVAVQAAGHDVFLTVNGVRVLEVRGLIDHINFGKISLYAENATVSVEDFSVELPHGDQVTQGVRTTVVIPDFYSNFMEIEETPDGHLLGIHWDERLLSTDGGETWEKTQEYPGINGRGYSTIHRLEDGSYVQVNYNTMKVTTSMDLKNWTEIGQVVPESEQFNKDGKRLSIFHLNSMVATKSPGGGTRLVLPVTFRRYRPGSASILGHYVRVYYSDDGGHTWTASENDTREMVPDFDEAGSASLAESKIIQLADGSLRMFVSRNNYGCIQYTESHDGGATWSSLAPIPQLQCSKSSHAVLEDPYHPGTYYMVWVNITPSSLGQLQPRYRFSLAKSTNGIDWEFVMDIERMGDAATDQTGSLYQILDPALMITQDEIYVTYGKSAEDTKSRVNEHNEQRVMLTRIDKSELTARPWDASTLAQTNFPASYEIDQLPGKTVYQLGEVFSLEGGTVRVRFLDGREEMQDMGRMKIADLPDMSQAGTHSIVLYQDNGFQLMFDIEVRQ